MKIRDAVDDYLLHCAVHLSPTTQRWYRGKLLPWSEAVGDLALEELRPAHIAQHLVSRRSAINPRTKEPLSSYTVHGDAEVVKGFLQWCLDNQYLASFPMRALKMPTVDEKVIEVFSSPQIKMLLAACALEETPWMAARDRSILLFLLDTGVRASELCGLDTAALDTHHRSAVVLGKGRKEREVGFGTETASHLIRYLRRYRRAQEGERAVFTTKRGNRLTPSGLDQMLYRLGSWSDITGVRISAHTFRHTFAVNYLLQGGDIYALSRLLGHTSVSTTQRYVRATTDAQVLHQRPSVVDMITGLGYNTTRQTHSR